MEGPALFRRHQVPAHRQKERRRKASRRSSKSARSNPTPSAILASVRAHWGIENNLHWTMDLTFDEDRCRTRKDLSPLNLAVIRHTAFNILETDKPAATYDENASEPASTHNSKQLSSPLNDLGFCPP
jgi:predicted transposase YbfD/YdcC